MREGMIPFGDFLNSGDFGKAHFTGARFPLSSLKGVN
jgi:hypothetical protein